jgi:MEMO1 family protein
MPVRPALTVEVVFAIMEGHAEEHHMSHRSFSLSALLIFAFAAGPAQNIRPVRDDVGFCWTKDEMKALISLVEKGTKAPPMTGRLVAGISPHDDYLYAARIYGPLYRSFRAKEVVIFGVTHGSVRRAMEIPNGRILLETFDAWRGPMGLVKPSPLRGFISERMDRRYLAISDSAHILEHSIEALIPFLQYWNPGVHITPIMVTPMESGRMDTVSEALAPIIAEYIHTNHLVPGKDIFFLFSSDANHYGRDFANIPYGEDSTAHERATAWDRELAKRYIAVPVTPAVVDTLAAQLQKVVWCGRYSVPFGMMTTEKVMEREFHKHLHGVTLGYSDSFTERVLPLKGTQMGLTAPFSLKHWVGYLAAGFYLE